MHPFAVKQLFSDAKIQYIFKIKRKNNVKNLYTGTKVRINHYLCRKINIMDINRLKIVLVEKKKTSKWLAEQLGVNPSTVSKWCTNTSQPPLESIISISKLLNVDIKELINNYE